MSGRTASRPPRSRSTRFEEKGPVRRALFLLPSHRLEAQAPDLARRALVDFGEDGVEAAQAGEPRAPPLPTSAAASGRADVWRAAPASCARPAAGWRRCDTETGDRDDAHRCRAERRDPRRRCGRALRRGSDQRRDGPSYASPARPVRRARSWVGSAGRACRLGGRGRGIEGDVLAVRRPQVSAVQAAAISEGGRSFWGVQYHPEFDFAAVAAIIALHADRHVNEGLARSREEVDGIVSDFRDFARDPARKDLAWRYGVGGDVLNPKVHRRIPQLAQGGGAARGRQALSENRTTARGSCDSGGAPWRGCRRPTSSTSAACRRGCRRGTASRIRDWRSA